MTMQRTTTPNPASVAPNPDLRNARTQFTAALSRLLRPFLGAVLVAAALSACSEQSGWHETDLTGSMPDLAFTMTRAKDGKQVTAASYKGDVTLLYFGYTFCPDICPVTMSNLAQILQKMGKTANDVRVLFVTVDPNRDTPKVLNQYTSAFAPQVDGLRGTADELAALARRYRVAYSVKPSKDPTEYKVTHSPAVYVFDQQGHIRLLMSSLASNSPDIKGAAADLTRLAKEGGSSGFLYELRHMI
jgi:protein SCO1/2